MRTLCLSDKAINPSTLTSNPHPTPTCINPPRSRNLYIYTQLYTTPCTKRPSTPAISISISLHLRWSALCTYVDAILCSTYTSLPPPPAPSHAHETRRTPYTVHRVCITYIHYLLTYIHILHYHACTCMYVYTHPIPTSRIHITRPRIPNPHRSTFRA